MELTDQLWRLRNLYDCRKEGSGQATEFIPRPEQEVVFRHLIETPRVPAYIIKSRRLGFSTGLGLFQVDSAVFSSGWRGVLLDRKQDDATKKMVEIIRFGVDSLPPELLSRIAFDKRNDSELRFRVAGEAESEDSVIFATTGIMGGDCTMLHVSEMGPISAMDPKRAAEIVTGSFPAARQGRRVIETTWRGGKSGELWELVKPILERDPNADGVIYFFPWHGDPAAVRTDGRVTEEIEEYFRDLAEKTGKAFSQEQKKWYAAKKVEYRNRVFGEFPSTLEEAFRAPIEGAIYAEAIDRLRSAGRIRSFPVDRSALVHTAWDLGAPVNTVTWYFQLIAGEVRVIDCDLELRLMATDRVAHIMSKGYPLGVHLLPHDAAATRISGRSSADVLTDAGLANVRIVPKTAGTWVGIDDTLAMFDRYAFHAENCGDGIARLENYRFEKVTEKGLTRTEPVHDHNSHAADAFRIIAEAMRAGILPSGLGGTKGVTATTKRRRGKVVTGYRGQR